MTAQTFKITFDGIILTALKKRASSLGATPERIIRMAVLEDEGIVNMVERVVEDGAAPVITTGWGLTQEQLAAWATLMSMPESAAEELVGYAKVYNSIPPLK